MEDTPPDILQKQREIIYQKTKEERFLIGADLIDAGWAIMKGNIRKHHPGISDLDLKIEVFKRCYSSFFSDDETEKIIQSLTDYHNMILKDKH